jgi:type I restriction enzyme S subunit
VTLEMFFEKFDRLADAPNAIDKLRELVLWLGVHGKLAIQSSDDEPADALLKRSRADMSTRMAARQAKEEKPAAPVAVDEMTFALPVGWAWCRLVDLGQFINGLAFKPSEWGTTGRPIIRIQNLSGRNRDYNRTTGEFDASVLVQDGDILVSWSATLDAFVWRGEEGVLNQHIFRVIPAQAADKRFLFWLLKFVIRELAASDHAHGLVMSHINRGPFLAHPIALPPLAEQTRIVAKVDELMELCDRLEEQQQEREKRHAVLSRAALARFADQPTGTNLNFLFHDSYAVEPADLRKTIISLAIQGRLVRQYPNDADSAALLVDIEVERRRYAEAHRFRAPTEEPIPAESAPFSLPTSWTWCRLSSICNAVTDGDHLPPPKSDDGIAFLTIGNITTGVLNFDGCRFVPKSYFERVAAFRRPTRGDILYTVVGATYGRPALVDTDRPFCVQRHIAILKPSKHIEVRFVMAVLRSALAYEQATASTTGTAQPTIPLGSLRSFMVPLPPIAEQRRIVEKVDQLMVRVDKLEADADASRIAGAELVRAAVAELTTQE